MVGALVALAAAVVSSTGLVLLKRGVDDISRVTWKPSRHVAREFFRSRIWLTGFVLQLFSLVLFIAALNLAPVTVVQPVKSSGVLVLVFLAAVYLKERITLRERFCIALVVAGLCMLGLSLSRVEGVPPVVAHGRLAAFGLISLAATGLLLGIAVAMKRAPDWGVGLGLIAGVLFGLSTLVTKAVTIVLDLHPFLSLPGLTYVGFMVALTLFPFLLEQAALQRGKASTVVPIIAALVATLPVLGGFWVFSERLPESALQQAARLGGIVAILIGAVALSQFSQPKVERVIHLPETADAVEVSG
ncbi:MAG: DMT family transporter [Actinomycetota bacterium]